VVEEISRSLKRASYRYFNPSLVSPAAANGGKIQDESQKSLNVELPVATLPQQPPLFDNN
jgi:hypothetical protein